MHKSIDTTEKKEYKPLEIITEKRNPTVEDFLPEYNLKYNYDTGEEAKEMAESLITFIKANKDLVLSEYNSSNLEAVQEGFSRGVAIAALFLHSLYLVGDVSGKE